jgi:hypothetical protein
MQRSRRQRVWRLQRPLVCSGIALHRRLRRGGLRMRRRRSQHDLLYGLCQRLRRLRHTGWQPRQALRLRRGELELQRRWKRCHLRRTRCKRLRRLRPSVGGAGRQLRNGMWRRYVGLRWRRRAGLLEPRGERLRWLRSARGAARNALRCCLRRWQLELRTGWCICNLRGGAAPAGHPLRDSLRRGYLRLLRRRHDRGLQRSTDQRLRWLLRAHRKARCLLRLRRRTLGLLRRWPRLLGRDGQRLWWLRRPCAAARPELRPLRNRDLQRRWRLCVLRRPAAQRLRWLRHPRWHSRSIMRLWR